MTMWKPIQEYNGLYEISLDGQVRKVSDGKLLKATFRPQYGGRYVYGLKDSNGKWKQHYQHILVAESFDRKKPFVTENGEAWKDIDNTHFQISSCGRMRAKKRIYFREDFSYSDFCLLRPEDNGHGYFYIFFNGHNHYVHRIVAKAFIPNPQKLPEVNHIDGNKHNNNVLNLEWVTRKQNEAHAIKHGLIKAGEKAPKAKFNAKEVCNIKRKYASGISSSALSAEYHVCVGTILKIAHGKTYQKETKTIPNC